MALRASLLTSLWVAASVPGIVQAGEVKGRVLMHAQPMAGITVAAVPYESPFAEAVREARAESAPKEVVSVVTRADGTFVLTLAPSALPPGASFRLRFSGPGIAPALCADVFAASDGDTVDELSVERGAALAGKVLNAKGGPVAGAKVTLWPSSANEELEPEPITTATASDGGFKFDLASERSNSLRVEAPGFAVVELERVRSGALTKPIVLRPGRSVDGVVLRNDHRTPAAGAVVRYEGQGVSRWVAAAANGAFHLDGVPEGAGALVADGGELGRIRVPLVEGGKPTLVLAPTAALTGRVVDAATAAPIARIRVVAHADRATFVARSGSDGRYALRGLPAERYRLTADDPRYVPWSAEVVRVGAARTTNRDIPLTLAATLTGRVVDENGSPVQNARGIFLNSSAPGVGPMRRMRATANYFVTLSDGTFSATRLMPGAGQTLTVVREDYEPRTLGGLSLRPGLNPKLTLVLAHGLALTGIVKDQGDRPIAGAELVLLQAFEARGGRGVGRGFGSDLVRMPIHVSKTTAADGRFEFKGLIPAEYGLSVTHAGHGHEQIGPLTLAADKPHEPIEVRLQAGATITGFVRDKSGKGVEGVVVTARRGVARLQGPSSGFGRQPSSEPTEADGAFTIDGLVAGEDYDLAPMAMALGVIPGGRALRQTGIAAPAEGIEFVLPGTGTIRGVVTDADGERTIADFEVSYSGAGMFGGFAGRGRRGNAGPNQPQSVHAEDGQFVLTEVPAGTWDVEVTAEGYQPARASGVTVEEGGAAEGVTITLQRGALVTGRVLDAGSGKPIVDAQVRARLQGENRGGVRFPDTGDGRNASSDADGHFELKGLPPGSYSVSATHPDYSDAAQTIAVKEQVATSVDLRLGKGGALAGVVVAGGRPVAGASVGLAAPGEGLGRGGMGGGGHSLTTDDAGRFRFDHLTPGRYSLMANLRSEASPPSEVVLLAGQSNESIVLTLGGGAVIHGHVLGLPETELASVMVSANGPEDYRANVRTDAGGAFELSGAPVGPIELRAMAGDFGGGMRTAGAQVVVAEGQAEASAEIRFASGFRIDGHVTRGGQGVADTFVTAFSGSGGGRSATDRTDANGAYALEGLPEGNYQVSTNGSSGTGRGGSTVSRAVTVTSDVTVDLEAPLARLAGIVVEGSTQRPLADANVQVTGAGRGGATTDSQGRFTLEGLEPRAYRVNVQKPAYQTETQELTASEDGEVRIELARGEGIGLQARDGVFGTPLRSVQVRVLDPQGQSVYGGSVPLDSDGRGEIPSLQPGSYQLRADASGYAPVSLSSITVPTSALTLTLTPGGALTIKSGPETLALPQASVRLLGANGQVYLPSIYSNDGSIRLNGPVRLLENVAPGRYTVSLNGGDGPPVDVREGEPAAVQFK